MCCSPFPELIRATVQAERLTPGNGFGPQALPVGLVAGRLYGDAISITHRQSSRAIRAGYARSDSRRHRPRGARKHQAGVPASSR